MIRIEVDDADLLLGLRALQDKVGDIAPALREIGEDLIESTKRRFETSKGPDGARWAANSPVTLSRYLGRTKGNLTKSGALSKKGQTRLAGKKPLIGESRQLSSGITYQISGNVLEVGSNLPYAAMQQFGGSRSEFPHLWGDIPARPFLGLSDEDKQAIVEVILRHLQR